MANQRDVHKRQVGIGIRISTLRRIEKRAALNGNTPSVELVNILEQGVRNVELTSDDYLKIAEEVRKNEQKRKSK